MISSVTVIIYDIVAHNLIYEITYKRIVAMKRVQVWYKITGIIQCGN